MSSYLPSPHRHAARWFSVALTACGLAAALIAVPQSAAEEPQSAAEEPQSAAEEPQSAAEEPQSTAEEPQSAAEEPQSAAEEPQSAAEEPQAAAEKTPDVKTPALPLPSVKEAEARARLLHELSHGALQVMHRDFFDEEESRVIPSHSLEDVFEEMNKTHQVEMAWLVVNADAMNIDNNPRDDFEKRAVKALSDGAKDHSEIEADRFRFVGAIRLSSRCLKCHVPYRKSTHDRVAGVVISMPIQPKE